MCMLKLYIHAHVLLHVLYIVHAKGREKRKRGRSLTLTGFIPYKVVHVHVTAAYVHYALALQHTVHCSTVSQ